MCLKFALEHMVPMDDDHKRMRLQVVRSFCSMYEWLDRATGMEELANAADCCKRALILWGELQQADLDAGDRQSRGFFLWKLYPKHHQLQHIMEDQMLVIGNPIHHCCYADESEIGVAVALGRTLHHNCLHNSVFKKHRLL